MSRSCVRGAIMASVTEEVLRRMRRMIREISPTEATITVWNVWLAGAETVRKAVLAESVLSADRSENPILFRTEDGAAGSVCIAFCEIAGMVLPRGKVSENLPLRK